MTPKYLGTLNVEAGDAGHISLEISTATPLERIAAVLRFADDMTDDKPAADVVAEAEREVVTEVDPPPVVAKPRRKPGRAVKASPAPKRPKPPKPASSPKVDVSLVCDVCGRACTGKRGLGIHRSAMHPNAPAAPTAATKAPAPLSNGAAPPASTNDDAEPAPTMSADDLARADALLLRCQDCDYVSPVTEFQTGIRRHVERDHGRDATPAERSPRTQADVDAAEAAAE